MSRKFRNKDISTYKPCSLTPSTLESGIEIISILKSLIPKLQCQGSLRMSLYLLTPSQCEYSYLVRLNDLLISFNNDASSSSLTKFSLIIISLKSSLAVELNSKYLLFETNCFSEDNVCSRCDRCNNRNTEHFFPPIPPP